MQRSCCNASVSNPLEKIDDDGAIVGRPKDPSISPIGPFLRGEESIDSLAMRLRALDFGLAARLEIAVTPLDIAVAIDEIHRVVRETWAGRRRALQDNVLMPEIVDLGFPLC